MVITSHREIIEESKFRRSEFYKEPNIQALRR